MESSRNHEVTPIGKTDRVRGILRAISDRYTGEVSYEPEPRPGEVGGVPTNPTYLGQLELDLDSTARTEFTAIDLNAIGEVSDDLKGMLVQRQAELDDYRGGRWDDQGRYYRG